MTPMIYVQEADMPTTIAAYTVERADGEYTIILNSRLSHERLMQAYDHEIRHIENGDFDNGNLELVEIMNHGQEIEE